MLSLTKENLKDDMDEKLEAPSFEEAMAKLEKIVEVLEDGGLTLEESTKLYEQGMKLATICGQRLSAAEIRITEIQTDYQIRRESQTSNITDI